MPGKSLGEPPRELHIDRPTPPPIEAPTGGGAIRAIDEKLTTSPTGAATIAIPLPASAARMPLDLALTYDSNAGNGPFGLGWSVALPAIARRTHKRLPRYRDDDVFVMSGVEDLVPVPDDISLVRDGHRVVRFRPRIDAAFTKIERWTELATGIAHWRTIDRSNVRRTFGRTAQARIVDPADPSHVFQWLLEEVRDDRGNIAAFEYKADGTNRYPKSIHYGNHAPFVAGEWHFELVFDYGEHAPAAPTPDEVMPWTARLDPFSTYRAGFEIRTARLCRRVLAFHRFPELGPEPCLVRSLDLSYAEDPVLTKLASLAQVGYIRAGAGYTKQAVPPLVFAYSEPVANPELHTLPEDSRRNIPEGVLGLDGSVYEWIDLDGEGVAGLFTEQGDAWFYKRNLGAGRLGPAELVAEKPRLAVAGGVQLLDLANDGRKQIVALAGPMPGFYTRRDDRDSWSRFVPFAERPVLDWQDKNIKLLDLDGDGRADVLVSEDHVWSWYRSLGLDGFGEAEHLAAARDEERGPALVFSDDTQAIYVADMSGDGLADVVRVRNGDVCYWPNLGFGRFGGKVTMQGAPWLDHPDEFDHRRIRLVDLDGSGPADLVYLGRRDVRYWRNQAGNGWSAPQTLTHLPPIDSVAQVATLDFLGTGTTCIVWSSPLWRDRAQPIAYVDLAGGVKPHLLVSVTNPLGAETRLAYASSTKFYLADREAGTPWATRLPFPVHVVERVETLDHVTGNRFVTTYSYHHGYFDRAEQEFRGFGRVDQLDTEEYAPFHGAGLFSPGSNALEDETLHVPPTLTRSWYHTGAFLDGQALASAFAAEYWNGDLHSQARLPDGPRLPAGDTRVAIEATRALKGALLRREVFALDNTAAASEPYTVTMHDYEVRLVQAFGSNVYAVTDVHANETMVYRYERQANDPRTQHTVVLERDSAGNEIRSMTIAYPRRAPQHPEQGRAALLYTERQVVNLDALDDDHRLGVVVATRTSECAPAGPVPARYTIAELDALVAALTEAPAEMPAAPGSRRTLERAETVFYRDDVAGALPLGTVEPRALRYETYTLTFTPQLVTDVYGDRVTDDMLVAAGYVSRDGAWWIPSGRAVPAASLFYAPAQFVDAAGNVSTLEYDAYALLPIKSTSSADPVLANTIAAEHDYRTLSPVLVTDRNGNRTATRTDELGRVVAMARQGKATGPVEGDTLADPTVRFEYDLAHQPPFARKLARERHGAANPRWQETVEYSDGFGRVVQTKSQAAGGTWIGTGRTVFNNKGLPVKQYEPFFSTTSAYEDEAALVAAGVTPILHYDPIGRAVRVDRPDGTTTRVEFDAWRYVQADANDCVLGSRWLEDHLAPSASADDKRAAQLASAHANTPAVIHLDPQGRAFLGVNDNADAGTVETRTQLDIAGRELATVDALGRTALSCFYDLAGGKVARTSIDAGAHWNLFDARGKLCRTWDSLGRSRRIVYDLLGRPTHVFLATDGGETLSDRTLYGEHLADAAAQNLRGHAVQHYDASGVVISASFDLHDKSHVLHQRLARAYKTAPDWSVLAAIDEPGAALAMAEPLLESETFTTTTVHDALERLISITSPDGSEAMPVYDEASRLEQLSVRLRGGPPQEFVAEISYDAKGQRTRIVYGSGVETRYTYDPLTFRLVRLETDASAGAGLQDLAYTYDPAGNITTIRDAAQPTIYFAGSVVSATRQFELDALYQLVRADGREHTGTVGDAQVTHEDAARMGKAHPHDGQQMRLYTERYAYDAVGNVLEVIHTAAESWTRRYEYETGSNRLRSSSLPGDGPGALPTRYTYDAHGSMTAMPHLPVIEWDARDQIRHVDLGGGGHAYYVYDAEGRRVRKVIETLGALVKERIYIGGYEIYRERSGDVLALQRDTVHILDDQRRIAIVDTLVVSGSTPVAAPVPVVRYELGDHLGSAALELDEAGNIISYEEYYPFGSTSYQAGPSAATVSLKRYRFTGKERDEETGLYYHGARYYACWLGRWTAADPAGAVDGPNLYAYALNNPIILHDPTGTKNVPVTPNDFTVMQMKDPQLIRHLRQLAVSDPGAPTAFLEGTTGMFGDRVAAAMRVANIPKIITLDPVNIEVQKQLTVPEEVEKELPQFPAADPGSEDLPQEEDVTDEERQAYEDANKWEPDDATKRMLEEWGLNHQGPQQRGPDGGGQGPECRSFCHARHPNMIPYWHKRGDKSDPGAEGRSQRKGPVSEKEAASRSAQNRGKVDKTSFGKELKKRYNAEKEAIEAQEGGFPDLSGDLYRKGPNDVNIGMLRGSRPADEAAANALCGYSKTPAGYTWHHHQDLGRMQLVRDGAHKLNHWGGAAIWKRIVSGTSY